MVIAEVIFIPVRILLTFFNNFAIILVIKVKGTFLIRNHTWLLILATMKDLVSEEGITTLFRGAGSTIQCVAASNFIYFYTFHGLKKWLSKDTPSALTDLLFACVAGKFKITLVRYEQEYLPSIFGNKLTI